jgi:hypothetical protein
MATPRSRLLPSLECRIPVYISDGSVIPSPPKRKPIERLKNFWPLIESLCPRSRCPVRRADAGFVCEEAFRLSRLDFRDEARRILSDRRD